MVSFEHFLRLAIEPGLLRFRRMPQQLRAHHRRQRQRHHRRHQDRHRQRDCELAEQPADDVAHEQQRNQHRDQRDGQRQNREADLLGALERGFQRLVAFLDEARDVFDHDDRVVNHEAGRNRQRHQRQVVQAVAEQVHHAERADQRERDRDAGDDRRRQAAQEQEDDHHDQRHRQHQLELHVGHRRANRGGAIGENLHLHRRRQRGLQARHQRLDPVHHRDDVGAGLALDVDDHGRRQVHPRRRLDVLGVVDRVGDVGKFDRRAVVIRDDQRHVILGREQLVVGPDRVRLLLAVEVALRLIDVGARDRSAQILERHAIRRERSRIGLDAHRRLLSAADTHQPDAGQLRDLLGQPRIRQIFNLVERQFLRGQRQREDWRVGRIGLAVNRRVRQIRRQVGRRRVDRRLHLLLGNVDIQVEIELQRDDRGAERAVRGHLREARHLAELPLERRRHR